MGRSILRGSKGIPLIKLDQYDKASVVHVFDVSQTGKNEKSLTPNIWEMSAELEKPMVERLSSIYGEVSADGFGNQLMALCEKVAEEHTSPFLADLLRDKGDSSIEHFDNDSIIESFQNILKESLQIMALSRCGLNPKDYVKENHLMDLPSYDTQLLVSHLGNSMQNISNEVLLHMEKIAKDHQAEIQSEKQAEKNLEKEEKTLAKADHLVYDIVGENYDKTEQSPDINKEVQDYGRKDEFIRANGGNLLRGGGRDTLSEPDNIGGQNLRQLQSGDVRQGTEQIHEGVSQGDTHTNGDRWDVEKTPLRNGHRSDGDVGNSNRPDDGERGSDGGSQDERPSPLGSTGGQHQGEGEGNRPERTDLRLDVPVETEEEPEQLSLFSSKTLGNDDNKRVFISDSEKINNILRDSKGVEEVFSAPFDLPKTDNKNELFRSILQLGTGNHVTKDKINYFMSYTNRLPKEKEVFLRESYGNRHLVVDDIKIHCHPKTGITVEIPEGEQVKEVSMS